MARAETRSFGFWLVLLGDTLVYVALLFVFSRARTTIRLLEADGPRVVDRPDGTWPDVPVEAVPSPMWVYAALGAFLVSALLHRYRAPLVVVLLGTLGACACLVVFWRHLLLDHGLIPRFGQYAGFVWVATILWGAHAAVACVVTAALAARRAAPSPLLGRFLAFQTVWGWILLPAVLTW